MPNPVRITMADLIVRVRGLINDNAEPLIFNDAEIMNELDRYRDDWRYIELAPLETRDSTGVITWLDYWATSTWLGPDPVGDWESDAKIYGNDGSGHSFADLTSFVSYADYLKGHWLLSQSIRPPVFIVGKTYDAYMASSALLSTWASREMLNFDASQMGTVAYRSQKYKMLLNQSREMAGRRRPVRMSISRPDVHPETRAPFRAW